MDSNEKCYFKLNDEKTSIEFRSNSKKLCNVVMFTTDPIEKIELDVERDFFMAAEDAKTYGIVDGILDRRPADSVQPA